MPESSDAPLYERQANAFSTLSSALDKDLLLYRAPIDTRFGDYLRSKVAARKNKRDSVGLIITTHGGLPDDAYRIARCLQESYKKITMYVFGHCKSAGTLVVTGGDELVMSDWGELGPMDIQILREDQMFRESGVVTEEAFSRLREESEATFQKLFESVLDFGGGRFSLKTASEIAVSLTSGLLSPLTGQIDPLKVGETSRQMRILVDYATRLSKLGKVQTRKAIAQLSSAYSSHSFVIDRKEAKRLFGEDFVRSPDKEETNLATLLGITARYPDGFADSSDGSQIRYLDNAVKGLTVRPSDSGQLDLLFEKEHTDDDDTDRDAQQTDQRGGEGTSPTQGKRNEGVSADGKAI